MHELAPAHYWFVGEEGQGRRWRPSCGRKTVPDWGRQKHTFGSKMMRPGRGKAAELREKKEVFRPENSN